jgi:hypothetical protein
MSGSSAYPLGVFVVAAAGLVWLMTWLIVTGITRLFGHQIPKATARRKQK